MQILQIYTHSPLRNFSYLVYSEETKEAFCIDPFDASQIKEQLEKHDLKLKAIINTHEHRDHTCGNQGLLGDFVKLNTSETLEVMDTPGHTFSHICLKLMDEKKERGVITGDTLFNAGVGNCHNGGDPKILYKTIAKQFMTLADEVKVYPGHDYWQNNLGFTLSVEADNQFISKVQKEYSDFQDQGKFLISDIGLEKKVNAFFHSTNETEFIKLRELRNNW